MKTAILYIRVSTDEQAKRGYSVSYQEEVLRYYCLIKDIYIIEAVVEDFSAKNFKRPIWSSLFAHCKGNKVKRPDYILFTLWNRFSRNIIEAYIMIKKLQDMGIAPQAIEQPLDMAVPENKIVLASYLATAEVENERKSLCVKAGMHKAKMQGRWMGSAPIGYCNKTSVTGEKCITPREPQATYIREAFELSAQGLFSIRHVYLIAKVNGLNCCLNTFWNALRNPVYCGRISIKTKDTAPMTVKGQHEKIISPMLFDQVQSILNRRKVKPAHKIGEQRNSLFPFRGLLYCPECGQRLTGSGSKGRSKRYFYYHCINQCGFRVRTDEVHRLFYEAVRVLRPDDMYLYLFTSILKRNYKRSSVLESIDQRYGIGKIEELQDHIVNARTLLLSKNIDAREYFKIKSACEVKIGILKNKLENAAQSLIQYNKMLDLMSSFLSTLDMIFEGCSINDKQKLIVLLYGRKFVWQESCFYNGLDNSARIIYNKEISNNRPLYEERVASEVELISIDCKKIFDIEYKKGHIISAIQAKNISRFLYDFAKLIIGLFIPSLYLKSAH